VEDALAAADVLRARTGKPRLPVGLWGWSQGAWAAALAAAESKLVRFLILIASTGVSPAVQMRYGTAEHLRRAGFGGDAQAELLELRLAYESAIRGTTSREVAQKIVDRYASRPWFSMAYVPRRLPRQMAWRDMDFDPQKVFLKVRVPTLLFYGESDEWSPVEASIDAWKAARRVSGNPNIEIVRLPGTTHAPTLGGKLNARAISPEYARAIQKWLEATLPHVASDDPGSAANH
jgi:pimeloyl-ACP methyl ester carboxylesterase